MDRNSEFLRALEQGRQAASGLLELLQREHQALVDDALDDFITLSEEKRARIAELETFDRHRARLLGDAGLSDDEAGMTDFLSRCPSDSAAQHWQAFLELLYRCQDQNEINGRMIHARRRQVEEALAILRGQLGTSELAYDPQGRPTTPAASKPIAKA